MISKKSLRISWNTSSHRSHRNTPAMERPTSGILMSRTGARGPGGEPGSRLDALIHAMRRAFIGRRAAGGSFALTKWERDAPRPARRCHGAFKSKTQRARVKTWAERKRFGSGRVFTVRALWEAGAAVMYIEERVNEHWRVWGTPTLQKTPTHTDPRKHK